MKKILCLIVTVICLAFSSSAQIQRQILGYTLGVSTKATVVNGLNNKGFELEVVKDAANRGPLFYLVKGGVSFAGCTWDDVRIGFVNGKFASIMLTSYISESQADKLEKTMLNKYSQYKTSNCNPYSRVWDFMDKKKTNAFLWISVRGEVTLSYSDEKLMGTESTSSSLNDL